MIEYVAPADAYSTSALVFENVAPAPDVFLVVPTPVIEDVTPAPAVNYTAPASVIVFSWHLHSKRSQKIHSTLLPKLG